jgi:intracellular multiplication protein IcmP
MAQQQQQSGDDSMAPVWGIVLLFGIIAIVWFSAHAYIVSFIFTINIFQAKLVALVLGPTTLSNEIYAMKTLDPSMVQWSDLVNYTTRVANYTRYPICLFLCVLAIILYRSDVTQRYHHAHDMRTLRAQEQANWPCIMPIIKQDLAKIDISTGPWAMALSPLEFARKYELLKKEDPLLDGVVSGQEMTAGIRRVDAKRIFTLQLGAMWEGFDRCPMHVRAIAAVFMSRINRDRKGATDILAALDKSSVTGKPDYTVANAALAKFQGTELVQEIVTKHAYVLTVLASLLQASRQDGVVPSAEFLWLKTVDRRLWYMLNCVGRQTPFAEVAGPFAHWRAEQAMHRRSLVPMIDEAIKALEIAVKEVKLSAKEVEGLLP